MALITTGNSFIRNLEQSGSLAMYMPLEGGFEGRYRRRLRAAGYASLCMTARGLGDLSAYLTGVHWCAPTSFGQKDIRVYYVPPVLTYQLEHLPPKSKGLVLWLIEGNIPVEQEVEYLTTLPQQEPRVKVAVEMGGDRSFRWKPLKDALSEMVLAG
jgi:NAD(P)H-quinone oxidoreductase subunit N